MKPKNNNFPHAVEFREQLDAAGYDKNTVVCFCTGVRKFIKSGLPMTHENADKF